MSRFLVLLVVSPLLAILLPGLLRFRLSIGVAGLKGDFSHFPLNFVAVTKPRQCLVLQFSESPDPSSEVMICH